jgi:protein involved in polysaccharide export with SLBB domain
MSFKTSIAHLGLAAIVASGTMGLSLAQTPAASATGAALLPAAATSANPQSALPAQTGPSPAQMGMGANSVNTQIQNRANNANPADASSIGNNANNNSRAEFGAINAVRSAPLPNQFQRFVQQSTGTALPLFGASLFNNPAAYSADSAAPAPSEYVLGPGDEVRVQIWGTFDFSGTFVIDRNGQINLPKVGVVTLIGVQLKDLEAVLLQKIGTVFKNVSLNATLGKLRGITVYVVGQATQPGTYNLSSLSTLVNALFVSGGPSEKGSMRNIELKRAGRTITKLDLYDFISKGDKSKDVALMPGDIIMIPPAGKRMALVGATDHAAIYEFKDGDKLRDVLALGGGLSSLASHQDASAERINPQDPKTPRKVQSLKLSAQGLDTTLQDGDVITLLPISPAFANAVTVQGTVAQAVKYPWTANMRITDLIPDSSALISPEYFTRKNNLAISIDATVAGKTIANRVNNSINQINWEYALIERLNPKELRTDIIPFNLGKAILQKDPLHNLLLQAGDVITILSNTDVQLPAERKTILVRIEGEVLAPGMYQTLPGETLSQLLQRAGGLTPRAYIYGTEFTRESVRKQQQENLDQVIRRLETQGQSAGATLAANLTGDRVAQAATLQQQQQQRMQAQIASLKALKSKGRVSLELDANKPELPSLPLEDGDTILVPTLPAFVAAAGSVNNDNVFIFRQGKTVADVLLAAGLNEDSEPNQAFVLRADGSIFSRRTAGWLSRFEGAKLMPGDTVVVPSKVDRESGYNTLMRGLRDWTQIFSNLGIGAAAIRTLRN